MIQGAPLMAITILETPTVHVEHPIHARHQFEKYFQILQSPGAKLPPLVDHLILAANVTTFVTYKIDVVAGVKVYCESPTAADFIRVRVHKDTGLEISSSSGSIKHARVMIEVLLPTACAVRSIDARNHGTIVVEDQVLTVNDPYAHVRLHASGDCKLLVSSRADINIKSLQLDPQGAAVIQVQAPMLSLREILQASTTGKGSVRVSVNKLKIPAAAMDASGCADIHIAATEIDVLAELYISTEGMGTIAIRSEFLRADRLRLNASGKGKLAVISTNKLVANYVGLSADGMGEAVLHSPAATCNASHIMANGMGVIHAAALLAREADVNVDGMGKIRFRASDAATTRGNGMGKVTIYAPLPGRITGHPTVASPLEDATIEAFALARQPIAAPLRTDTFENAPPSECQSFMATIKSLWKGHEDNIAVDKQAASS